MNTTTAHVAYWGTLARTPITTTGAAGHPITRLRLVRVNSTAIGHGAIVADATMIDVTVTGTLPALDLGIIDVGDRVHITTANDLHANPGTVPVVHTTADHVDFPIAYGA